MVKYIKPFKASDLMDVNLVPNREFNVTSYFGCYQVETIDQIDPETSQVTKVATGFQGRDPNVFFEQQSSGLGRGCRGSLQGRTGILYHDSVALDGSISTVSRSLQHNR
jgi:hypothetical protein